MKFLPVAAVLVVVAFATTTTTTVSVIAEPKKNYTEVVEAAKRCIDDNKKNERAECVQKFLEDIVPVASTPEGIPELNIPSLDPLLIKSHESVATAQLIKGDFRVTDVKVTGLNKFEVKGLVLDMDKNTVTVNTSLPLVVMAGQYLIDGVVMVMPFEGNGTFWMKMNDVDVTFKGTVNKKDNRLELDDRFFDINLKNGSTHLSNLLGGDEVGVAVNNIINSNFVILFNEMKPFTMELLNEIGDGAVVAPLKSLPASLLDP